MDNFKKLSLFASLIRVESLTRELDNYITMFDTLPSEAAEEIKHKDYTFVYHRIYQGEAYGEYATFQYKDNYYNIIDRQLAIVKAQSEEDQWSYNMIDFTEQNMKLIRQFIINKDELSKVLTVLWFI